MNVSLKEPRVVAVLAGALAAAAAGLWWLGWGSPRAQAVAAVKDRDGWIITEDLPGGRVVSVVFTGRPVGGADVAALRPLAPFQRLFLQGTRVDDDGLAAAAKLPGLKWLSVTRCPVTDRGLEHLRGMDSLEFLELTETRVTDAGLAHLGGMTGLRILVLDGTAVSDRGLEHLRGLAGLERLSALWTKVTVGGAAGLRRTLPGLREVAVGEGDD